jgi:hypothetical protein
MAADPFLDEWHRIVSKRDMEALHDALAEDVTIGAPPYWTKLEGRPIVHHLLGLIIETIEGFTYYREWQDGNELALEFQGRVGDLDVQGIDLITLNEQGQVQNLDVLMRPTNTIVRLQEIVGPRMADFLQHR